MKKILVILGTRPEVIKLAPVIQALRQHQTDFQTRICDTGQHQELKQSALEFFQIQPDFQLDGLNHSQTLSSLTAYLLQQLPGVFADFQPDVVLVQGDTSSAFAGSLAAFHARIKVAHVEAGLRSYEKAAPYPEEVNRTLISHIADWHFAPTELARQNLVHEGIAAANIYVVGNTVVDALHWTLETLAQHTPPAIEVLQKKLKTWQQPHRKMLLFTLHRRENLEHHREEIAAALREIIATYPVFVLFPVHLNPAVQQWAQALAQDVPQLLLTEPLPYEAFVWAMQQSDLILTDSGGIQEEAPTLGKPVIVLRTQTERPEAQTQGTVHQVSIQRAEVIASVRQILQQPPPGAPLGNPFGDGTAAKKLVEILKRALRTAPF